MTLPSSDANDSRRPLLVFSDDWGRHPSSSQHLIRRLLPDRPVLWVNTIGTRPPRLDLRTARRVAEKLGHWVSPAAAPRTDTLASTGRDAAPPSASPRIVSPRMWPSFGSAWARRLNRHLLAKALLPEILALPQPPIAITTLPITADLVGVLPVHRWVYYCVDDFSQWPGYDGETMQVMERALLPRMDRVIAVSETLVDNLAAQGVSADLLTHGVDLTHWRSTLAVPRGPDPSARTERPPQVVFWGVVDRRLDLDWVSALGRALIDRHPGATLRLIGPQEDPDPTLFALPGVVVAPAVPYADLPAVAASADALVMPYADRPVTRAMQPLKLKEYLATGRPAIVRALPATRPWSAACDVCDSGQDFVHAVLTRLDTGTPAGQQAARGALSEEDWDAKATRFGRLIDEGDGRSEARAA